MASSIPKRDVSVSWPRCVRCPHRHEPGSACPPMRTYRATVGLANQDGVIWLVRPMPPGQWPADRSLPRDDSFAWWVRSHCGHEGGARQWAFYDLRYARMYEAVFRDDPCRYTWCQDRKREGDA